MSKGDAGRAQNAINYQGGLAQNYLGNVRGNLLPQNQALQNRFNTAADQSGQDYSRLMGGYNQFAQTGGFSPQNIQDIRARAIAPTRAVYQNAQSNIDRQRALAGYSPNYTAATAHLTRGLADATSDANVNANASIAQLIQQGKLAGLGGATNLYGQAPGMPSMYGQQLGQANQQQINLQELQNQLGLGLIGAQINKSQVPSNYQQALGNIGGTLGLVKKAGDIIGGTPS